MLPEGRKIQLRVTACSMQCQQHSEHLTKDAGSLWLEHSRSHCRHGRHLQEQQFWN